MNYEKFISLSPKELEGTWKIFIDENSSYAHKTPFIVIIDQFIKWTGFSQYDISFLECNGIKSNSTDNKIDKLFFMLSDDYEYIKIK